MLFPSCTCQGVKGFSPLWSASAAILFSFGESSSLCLLALLLSVILPGRPLALVTYCWPPGLSVTGCSRGQAPGPSDRCPAWSQLFSPLSGLSLAWGWTPGCESRQVLGFISWDRCGHQPRKRGAWEDPNLDAAKCSTREVAHSTHQSSRVYMRRESAPQNHGNALPFAVCGGGGWRRKKDENKTKQEK